MVDCPICGKPVKERDINSHLDSACQDFIIDPAEGAQRPANVPSFFQTPAAKRAASLTAKNGQSPATATSQATKRHVTEASPAGTDGLKRSLDGELPDGSAAPDAARPEPPPKRPKFNALEKAAPLAERMRPRTLDEVCGQELVGPNGVIRGLIEQDRVPSMVLWGGPGTGKTTVARIIANTTGSRFIEINSTSSGVGECKKLFADALNELKLTGRKTIIFCDEIHRFSKSQQDVFLGPVEAGQITLIGATTENPSFKVVDPLLSRCRVFTLSKLSDASITLILQRALAAENATSPLLDADMLSYLSAFAAGDARTALNLLELAISLCSRPTTTKETIKRSLTQTLVYDRQGDTHYDTISAYHKSLRGSDPDAALFYLARMLHAGEDPLYIARRLVVCASEDVGLADNAMLPLAVAAYTAAEKIGMPECRINLAHATVAVALARKSTRAYRALEKAMLCVQQEGGGGRGMEVPVHLRNAPTRLLREMGVGAEYKYPPDYVGGRVRQEYLPEGLRGRRFLEERDLGALADPELEGEGGDGADGTMVVDGKVDGAGMRAEREADGRVGGPDELPG